jgi:phospholipase D1/2
VKLIPLAADFCADWRNIAPMATKRGPAWGKIAIIAAVIAALAAAWRWTPLGEIATADNILAWSRTVRDMWWAPIALMAAYTVGAFILFPRPVLTLVSVMTFGVRWGLVYATAGILLAALVTYYTGRLMKRDTLKRIAGDNIDAAAKPVKRHGVIAVFASNMLPTPPFAVQNMIAGAIRIKLWEFLAGTAIALIPGILAWTVFGDQIMNALDESSKVNYWLVGGVLVLFTAFIFATRHFLKRKGY